MIETSVKREQFKKFNRTRLALDEAQRMSDILKGTTHEDEFQAKVKGIGHIRFGLWLELHNKI